MARRPRAPSGRLIWEKGGHNRLVDPSALELRPKERHLSRAQVVKHLADSTTRFVVDRRSRLTWYAQEERRRIWIEDISPEFDDVTGWRPPPDAPGQRPFSAVLFESADHQTRVVLFTHFD